MHSTPRSTTTNQDGEYSFENVAAGSHTIYFEPPEGTDLAVSDEVKFQMYSNGSISVMNGSKYAMSFENSDGTVAKNQLQLLTYDNQQIHIEGQGSNIASTVTFQQPQNAKSMQVRSQGLHDDSKKTSYFSGSSIDKVLSIDGNQQPTNQTLQIAAQIQSATFTESGTFTGTDPTLSIKGNKKPSDVSLKLDGSYSESSHRQSFNSLYSYAGDRVYKSTYLGGNLPPADAQLRVTANKWYEPEEGNYHKSILCKRKWNDHIESWTWRSKSASGNKDIVTASSDGTYKIKVTYRLEAYVGYCGRRDFAGDLEATIEANGTTFGQAYLSADYHTGDGEKKKDTVTKTVILEEGQPVKVDYDMTGGAVVDVEATAKKLASNPETATYEINGESFQISGLDRGETKTIPVSNLQTGQNSIRIKAGKGDVNLDTRLTWTERVGTENPRVVMNGMSVCNKNGILTGEMTCDIPSSAVTPGQYTFDIATDRGPVNYTLTYDGRAVPVDATINIGGQQYNYPSDFGSDGLLPVKAGKAPQENISSLSLGETDIQIQTGKVDGIQTALNASLTYEGDSRQTHQPKVEVENADGTVHTKAVPSTKLTNGKLYGNVTLDLPAEWFSEGENTIRVETADSSQIYAVVEGSGLTYQYNRFGPSTEGKDDG